MKRILAMVFCVACILTSVSAYGSVPSSALSVERLECVVDNADLLTDSEEAALEKKIENIGEKYQYSVVLLTENSLGGKTPQAYADDFYNGYGYGYGPDKDGMLYLISMEDRDYYTSTTGFGIKAFTDYGIKHINKKSATFLKSEKYYEAFDTYLDNVAVFVKEARGGKPFDSNHPVPLNMTWGTVFTGTFAFFLPVGIVIGFLVVLYMKFKMKPVAKRPFAREYIRKNSFVLDREEDVFLYSNTISVPIPKNNTSGSSTHTGSSGTSHGGGGGKF